LGADSVAAAHDLERGDTPAEPARPSDVPLAKIGERFGRFRIVGELGRGGFGIVYLADDPVLNRRVALKVPHPHTLTSPDLRQRFLREARAAAVLDHPHAVPVYEAGEVEHVCYIASAYCPGTNLADWLQRQPGPPPFRLAAALLTCVAEAVAHAHDRGIIHRDLKPANILLAPRPAEDPPGAAGEIPFVPKLTDFGLARLNEAEVDLTTSGIVMGTPAYMAPEQAEGWSQAVGPATDTYALGVILYELLAGRLPFQGSSLLLTLDQVRAGQPLPPSRWRPELPRDLETICLKCLRHEPAERYASAADLAEDLRRYLNQEPIRARPLGLMGRLRSWCRRPERIRDAAAIGALYCIVTVAVNTGGVALTLVVHPPVGDPLQAFWGQIGFVFVFGPLLACVAWRTARRDVVALWAGPLVLLFLALSQVWSGIVTASGDGLTDFQKSPLIWYSLGLTLGALSGGMLISYVLALVAYYANRHRPGFLPERPPVSDKRKDVPAPGGRPTGSTAE
jgi:tRNA A-37 threonylcarbamoyl transferase component Bud32